MHGEQKNITDFCALGISFLLNSYTLTQLDAESYNVEERKLSKPSTPSGLNLFKPPLRAAHALAFLMPLGLLGRTARFPLPNRTLMQRDS